MLANSNVTEKQKAKYGKQKNEDNRRAVEAYLRTKDLEDTAIFGIMGVIDKETGGSFDYQQKQYDGPGYGLFQLDPGGDHVNQYNRFLTKAGKQDSMEAQLDYFIDSIFNEKSEALISNGAGNAREIRKAFNSGDVNRIVAEVTNRWERPRDYIDREKEGLNKHGIEYDLAYQNNIFERTQRANQAAISSGLDKIPGKFKPDFTSTPAQVRPETENKYALHFDFVLPIWQGGTKSLEERDGRFDVEAKFARNKIRQGAGDGKKADKALDLIANDTTQITERDGKFWILPSRNLETGEKFTTDEEAYSAIGPAIRDGSVVGYDSREEAQNDQKTIFKKLMKEYNPFT